MGLGGTQRAPGMLQAEEAGLHLRVHLCALTQFGLRLAELALERSNLIPERLVCASGTRRAALHLHHRHTLLLLRLLRLLRLLLLLILHASRGGRRGLSESTGVEHAGWRGRRGGAKRAGVEGGGRGGGRRSSAKGGGVEGASGRGRRSLAEAAKVGQPCPFC